MWGCRYILAGCEFILPASCSAFNFVFKSDTYLLGCINVLLSFLAFARSFEIEIERRLWENAKITFALLANLL